MAAPIYFPWPAVALFLGTLLGAAGLAAPVDPAGALPALFGALTGLVGAFLSPKSRAWPGMLAGLAGFALLALGPGPLVLWLACLAFSAGAGLESLRTGGRATVMTLHGWLALHLMATMPPPEIAAPFAAAGLLAGWAVAEVTGLAGKAAPPKGDPRFGLALALYLAIGLTVVLLVIRHLESPFAHWVALMFCLRALVPPGMTARATLRFGVGAALGCLAALAFIALHLPHGLAIALAALLLIAGLRLIPHPRPYTPAAISAAVLLLVAPDVQPALFRFEVTLLVVLLSLGLASGLALLLSPRDTAPAR